MFLSIAHVLFGGKRKHILLHHKAATYIQQHGSVYAQYQDLPLKRMFMK